MRKNVKQEYLKPADLEAREREYDRHIIALNSQKPTINISHSENSILENAQKNKIKQSIQAELTAQKIFSQIGRTTTPRVHRRQKFPRYPLSSKKQVFDDPFIPRVQTINYSKKNKSYFLNDIETDSTEIESELELSMPPNVLLNQATQVDPLMTRQQLFMELTMIGESKAAKRRKRTLVTLPSEYIDIGIRSDAEKSEELEKLLNSTFPKDGKMKKKKFSSLYTKKQQTVGSTEISPIQTERKINYYNYNLSDELQHSCKKVEKHPVSIDDYKNQKKQQKSVMVLKPITEDDLGIMEVTTQKEYFFTNDVSIEPTRKLELSDPIITLSLV